MLAWLGADGASAPTAMVEKLGYAEVITKMGWTICVTGIISECF